ncbi:hypothetical protein GF402_07170 [Candidatus Fermentibacteria bacterium]|nr:hypothetical protein [Candidatus Fermentibacteria bacterium]
MGPARGTLENPVRILVISILAALLPLLLMLGARTAIRWRIESRIGRVDDRASVGSVYPAPGAILLRDVELPGKGVHLSRAWVFYTIDGLGVTADSVLVGGGSFVTSMGGDGADGESSPGGLGIPPTRFTAVRLYGEGGAGGSSMTVNGRLSGLDPGDSLTCLGRNEGGMVSVRLWRGFHDDSLQARFYDWGSVPLGMVPLPRYLRGGRYSGVLRGSLRGTGNGLLSGVMTSLDGQRVRIPMTVVLEEGAVRAFLTVELSMLEEWLERRCRSISDSVFVELAATGRMELGLSAGGDVVFELDGGLREASVYSPALSRDTVSFNVHARCRGVANPEDESFRVGEGYLTMGTATARFDIDGSYGDRRRMRIRIWSDSLAGEDLSSSVPEGLLGRLRNLSLGGWMRFDVTLALDWDFPDSCDFQAMVDADRLYVRSSPIGFGELAGTGARCRLTDSWRNSRVIGLDTLSNPSFLAYDSLPPAFEPLLLCAEDATFHRHEGFCKYHIRNSIREDMATGSFRRGGSTISMQLVKNLFLDREKLLGRKVQEVFLTWRLEHYVSKERIIELYANVVELGPNVFGLREAARYYFDLPPSRLSTLQTSFLVSILPGPSIYHRFYTAGRVPEYWRRYMDRLIEICGRKEWLPEDSVEQALRDTLIFSYPSGSILR